MFLYPISKSDPKIIDKVEEDLKSNLPKMIVINGEIIYGSLIDILGENYKFPKEIGEYKIYEIEENKWKKS